MSVRTMPGSGGATGQRGRAISAARLGDVGVVRAPRDSRIPQPALLPFDAALPGPGAARAQAGVGPALRLQLLGAPELQRVVPLRFVAERRFRLLAILALRGDWVSRDELAALFWPDRPQEAARSNLRKLLLEVRALGLPQVESDRSGMRWLIATDVADFRAALQRGDADAALALYRGPAMQGLDGGDSGEFSAWLTAERARLHAAWRDAATTALSQRDPAGVLELTHRLLDDDPYDEDAMVAALDAHHARGDAVGAAAAFRSYAEQLIEGLGVEPSARVRAAAARATGPVVEPAAAPRRRSTDGPASGNAPVTIAAGVLGDSFIGRTQELEELSALLRSSECRLLTVTGPGGMGKSCLAKHVVRGLEAHYGDGITWIALDDLTDSSQVAPRLACALGLELAPRQDAVERSAQYLAPRHTLLVFDNAEHLPQLSVLIERLLAAAPRLQVLITSRTRIGAAGEWLVPLAGLALPPADLAPDAVAASDAVRLFVAQARATDPRFNVAANATQIAALVRAVGGLPLAILLAAGWLRLVPMDELAQEAMQSLDVLDRAEEGDERPEHRSVRATFELSWRLLAPAEQRALATLSVMAGSFSRGAARDVAQASLPLLAALVDKSLLQVDGRGRFCLHPLIQQFAAEKLGSDARAQEAARAAHCRHFDQWLRRTTDVPRAQEPAALRLIESDLENLLAMWRHAVSTLAFDTLGATAVPLMRFFELRSRWDEGYRLLDAGAAALAAQRSSERAALTGHANVLRALATLDYRAGLNARCIERAKESLHLCRRLGIRKGIKGNLNSLGLAAWQLARHDEAAGYFSAASDEARADGDRDGEAIFLGNAALVAKAQGKYQQALRWAQAALDVHRLRNNVVSVLVALNNLGNLYRALQQPRQAIAVLTEALALQPQDARNSTRVFVLCNLALAHDDLAEYDLALLHAEGALTLQRSIGEPALEVSIRQALARAHAGCGRFAEATGHLARALRLALAEQRIGVAVGTLMHWGTLLAARGEVAHAAEVLSFAVNHKDIDAPDRDAAKRALIAIGTRAGPEPADRSARTTPTVTLEALAARLFSDADAQPLRTAP